MFTADCIQRTAEKSKKIEADLSLIANCSKTIQKDSIKTDCDNRTNKSHAQTAEKTLLVLSLAGCCYCSESWNLQLRDSSIPESYLSSKEPSLFGNQLQTWDFPLWNLIKTGGSNQSCQTVGPRLRKSLHLSRCYAHTHNSNSKHALIIISHEYALMCFFFLGVLCKCVAYVLMKYRQNQ